MILLDTHVLLWQEQGDRRLGPQTRRAIERALQENGAAVSAISFWEIGMRVEKGRLDFLLDLGAWRRNLLEHGLLEIRVRMAERIAVSARALAYAGACTASRPWRPSSGVRPRRSRPPLDEAKSVEEARSGLVRRQSTRPLAAATA